MIDKVFNVVGGGRPSDYSGAEGVDRGLDQHIGQRKDDALKTGRQANLQNLSQDAPVNGQFLPVQAQRSILLGQAENRQPAAKS